MLLQWCMQRFNIYIYAVLYVYLISTSWCLLYTAHILFSSCVLLTSYITTSPLYYIGTYVCACNTKWLSLICHLWIVFIWRYFFQIWLTKQRHHNIYWSVTSHHCHHLYVYVNVTILLWSPYVIGQTIIFLPCDFYLSFFLFFPRLISVVWDWMSTILEHMV